MTRQTNFRDVEKLSAYLDGQLSTAETARLESRLASDPALAAVLDALRQSRSVLRRLPQRRPPRNFTLTPKMAGLRAPTPRAVPALRFATIMATVLLAITFATNTIAPMAASLQAPMPYGIGGGGAEGPAERTQSGGGSDVMEEPAMEEPATTEEVLAAEAPQEPAAPSVDLAMATATPESNDAQYAPEPTQSLKVPEAPTEAVEEEIQPQQTPEPSPAPQVISSAWQVGLFAVAVILGLAALFLYWNSQRKFRRNLKK
jgi:hypothetical protein